jgi:hypothetical protein
MMGLATFIVRIARASIVDWTDPTSNLYGCQNCPICFSKFRAVFNNRPDVIQCDDCGFEQKAHKVNEDDQGAAS